uniref:Uncharacterized protein n=1 Tax=Oryza glumipatula TaxID=40148 RepID=A0A0E0B2I9_9ORYZ
MAASPSGIAAAARGELPLSPGELRALTSAPPREVVAAWRLPTAAATVVLKTVAPSSPSDDGAVEEKADAEGDVTASDTKCDASCVNVSVLNRHRNRHLFGFTISAASVYDIALKAD